MAANPYDLTTRESAQHRVPRETEAVGVFLVLCAAVIGYGYTLSPYYEATTRLLVKTGREFQVRSDPNQQVASVPAQTKLEIVNSEIQILTSRDLVEAVINKIGINRLYPGLGGGRPEQAMDAAVRNFQGDFKAAPVEQADVIEASYRHPDHEVAVQALKEMVELYQHKHAEMFSDPRYKFLEQQSQAI